MALGEKGGLGLENLKEAAADITQTDQQEAAGEGRGPAPGHCRIRAQVYSCSRMKSLGLAIVSNPSFR